MVPVSHTKPEPHSPFEPVKFQADSALLRELGERLVGQPHIALAELIKNAYDADATECSVSIDQDEITITDNGHGMTRSEFLNYWMTIGTRNKQDHRESRHFKRNVTGSKGVGRLSAQFLAHKLEIITTPRDNHTVQLRALVDWDAAADAGHLTEAEAHYRMEPANLRFARKNSYGTKVILTQLKKHWTREDIRDLGRQLWMIQSPVRGYGLLTTGQPDADDFQITLSSSLSGIEDTFDDQMKIALQNYFATIYGRLENDGDQSTVRVQVKFESGEHYSEHFPVDPLIYQAQWLIRVFDLSGRQRGGIKVKTARDYFGRFGGVQVYDAGFRLPYYGVEQDWLGIEFDHSHRRNRSALLPDRLQVRRALNDLPTQGRLFGVVAIDTGREAQRASTAQQESGDFLKIQVTRDRLVTNAPYNCLRDAVRWSLDYYATRQRLREHRRIDRIRPKEPSHKIFHRIRSLLDEALDRHPDDDTLHAIQKEFRTLSNAIRRENEADSAVHALLGPLAAAGMAALALEHESRKEMRRAYELSARLRHIGAETQDERLSNISNAFDTWTRRLEDTRQVFGPLLHPDDRHPVDVLAAEAVLQEVIRNVTPLVTGLTFLVDVPTDIFLPAATFAEWNSLFQNIFMNAANATLDQNDRRVQCIGGRTGRSVWIRVEDNGIGVDVQHSSDLFEPFNRLTGISEERRALGLGGMGLGLTIVRMIANRRRARVGFVQPSPGWSTALRLSWSHTP